MSDDRFIIAGTGRSGTKWCATTLRIAGIACGHEQVFRTEDLPDMRRQEWRGFDGDASLAAVPFLHRHRDAKVVLVVRHPLAVATSILRSGPFLERSQPQGLMTYVAERYPEIFDAPDDKVASIRYWTIWNDMALPFADTVARIENLTGDELLKAVGRTPRLEPFPLVHVNRGPSKGPRVDWADIPEPDRSRTFGLMQQLGYEVKA